MPAYEIAMLVGVCAALFGAALTLRLVLRRSREIKAGRPTMRLETLAELAAPAVVFGGMSLVQLANIALHVATRTVPESIWLSIFATASVIFVFGALLGRVITRWQLRRLDAMIDSRTGAIHARG